MKDKVKKGNRYEVTLVSTKKEYVKDYSTKDIF